MAGLFVPPGGMAGFAQQVPAVKNRVARAARGRAATTGKRRRRTKKKVGAAPRARRRKTTTKRKSSKGNRFAKGSAAAKRYMAKIRKMRKK